MSQIELRQVHDRHMWAQPGDEEDRVFILRFSDPDCRDQVFTGDGAEDRAIAAWNLYSPNWNVYLFGTMPTLPPSTRPLPSADRAEPVGVADLETDLSTIVEYYQRFDGGIPEHYGKAFARLAARVPSEAANLASLIAPPPDKVEVTREELIALIMEETTDGITPVGGRPNVLIQGCKFIRRQYRDSATDGYENPEEAAGKFAGFIADRVLKRLSHSTGEG